MSALALRSKDKKDKVHKLFVGVDYGTTFTGKLSSNHSNIAKCGRRKAWRGFHQRNQALTMSPSFLPGQDQHELATLFPRRHRALHMSGKIKTQSRKATNGAISLHPR